MSNDVAEVIVPFVYFAAVCLGAGLSRLAQRRDRWWLPTAAALGAGFAVAPPPDWPPARCLALAIVGGCLSAVLALWLRQRGTATAAALAQMAPMMLVIFATGSWRTERANGLLPGPLSPAVVVLVALAAALLVTLSGLSRLEPELRIVLRALLLGVLGLATVAAVVAASAGSAPTAAWVPDVAPVLAALWLPVMVEDGARPRDRTFGLDAFHARSAGLLTVALLGVWLG